ncbi:hypothetical protein A2U01_0040673, partial [Trifolium medium]|nr:hypothetical protein [Trifolium medium]
MGKKNYLQNADLTLIVQQQKMLPSYVAGMQDHPAAGCWDVWILQ